MYITTPNHSRLGSKVARWKALDMRSTVICRGLRNSITVFHGTASNMGPKLRNRRLNLQFPVARGAPRRAPRCGHAWHHHAPYPRWGTIPRSRWTPGRRPFAPTLVRAKYQAVSGSSRQISGGWTPIWKTSPLRRKTVQGQDEL